MARKAKRDDWRTDPADVTAALLRAARRAHEIARDTGTKVVVVVDGETIEMDPNPEMFDDLDPRSPRRENPLRYRRFVRH